MSYKAYTTIDADNDLNDTVDCSQCSCYYCSRNKIGCKGCEGCNKKAIINDCKQYREEEISY